MLLGVMFVAIINLGKLISRALHVPHIDGYPVYGRVDYELEGRSKDWYKKLKDGNNSPSNIRRVFITMDGVLLSFYSSVGGLGRNTFVKYDTDLIGSIRDGAELTSHVLNSFNTEWVLSNIEELYIDSSIFLNTEYNKSSNITQDIIEGIVRQYIDISKYSRLLIIGYIPNLIDLLKETDIVACNGIDKKWYLVYKDKIKMLGFKVSNDLYNTNFTCKDGIYTYDKDVLCERFKLYSDRLKVLFNEKYKTVEISDSTDTSSIKDLLKGMDKLTNINVLKLYLNALLVSLDSNERVNVMDELIGQTDNIGLKNNLVSLKGKI